MDNKKEGAHHQVTSEHEVSAAEAFREGEINYLNGDFKNAKIKYEEAITLDSENVSFLTRVRDCNNQIKKNDQVIRFREATNLANAGHLAAAIMEISCAIELDSTNLAYYNRRRSWYEELGILDKYIDDCKKILRLDGGADPYVFCDLIKALMQITEITGEKYAVLDLDEVLAEGLQLFPQHSELVKLRERRQDQKAPEKGEVASQAGGESVATNTTTTYHHLFTTFHCVTSLGIIRIGDLIRLLDDSEDWSTLHEWAMHYRKSNQLTISQFCAEFQIPDSPTHQRYLNASGSMLNVSRKIGSVGKKLMELLTIAKAKQSSSTSQKPTFNLSVRVVEGDGTVGSFSLEALSDDFGDSVGCRFTSFGDYLACANAKSWPGHIYSVEDIFVLSGEDSYSIGDLGIRCQKKVIEWDYDDNVELGLQMILNGLGLQSVTGATRSTSMLSLQLASYWVLRVLEQLDFFDTSVEGFCSVGFCESAAKDYLLYLNSSPMYELQPPNYWIVKYFNWVVTATVKNPCVSTVNSVSWNQADGQSTFVNDVATVYTLANCTPDHVRQSYSLLQAEMRSKMDIERDISVYFHATDEASMTSILSQGIDPFRGHRCQDLGHRNGFYLHLEDNLHLALEWTRIFANPAILVFAVYTDEMNILQKYDMGADSGDPWREYVSTHRRMHNNLHSIDQYAYIRGLACGNPRQVQMQTNHHHPTPHSDSFVQVCLKNHGNNGQQHLAVDLFHRSLAGVIYIQ